MLATKWRASKVPRDLVKDNPVDAPAAVFVGKMALQSHAAVPRSFESLATLEQGPAKGPVLLFERLHLAAVLGI